MGALTLDQLGTYGPDHCDAMTVEQARAYCHSLARQHEENFSVLSPLVPAALRDDFAAVYAFCRWADDLGDEVRDTDRALELLAWWRRELEQAFADEPRHPVLIALHQTIRRHDLPITPFDDLIRAFEQDQTVTRYDTWDQLIDYCRRSANPVGRLVLMICGEPRDTEHFQRSDAVCTALQLTNHWQDVKRDILDRDRIYLPAELHDIADFETRLKASATQGYAVDREFLGATRDLLRVCTERTWKLYERGETLLPLLQPTTRPIIWLFLAGGEHVLRKIELWNYETALHRPRLSKLRKIALVARAMLRARRAGSGEGATT